MEKRNTPPGHGTSANLFLFFFSLSGYVLARDLNVDKQNVDKQVQEMDGWMDG